MVESVVSLAFLCQFLCIIPLSSLPMFVNRVAIGKMLACLWCLLE